MNIEEGLDGIGAVVADHCQWPTGRLPGVHEVGLRSAWAERIAQHRLVCAEGGFDVKFTMIRLGFLEIHHEKVIVRSGDDEITVTGSK